MPLDELDGDTRRKLWQEVHDLRKETLGYDDALNYVGDIASDLSIDVELVVKELKRQCGRV